MDQELVSRLEVEIEKAISDVIMQMGRSPHLPSQHTMHMMAKAEVSVYEAAAESHNRVEQGATTK